MSTERIETVMEDRVFGSGIAIGKTISQPLLKESGTLKMPSSVEISRLVRKGMDGAYLKRLCERIPRIILADTLGTEISNFSKFYKRTLSKSQTDDINDLTLIWSEMEAFFERDKELLDEWINAPTPQFSGAQPIELLGTIIGRDEIRRALELMSNGDFG